MRGADRGRIAKQLIEKPLGAPLDDGAEQLLLTVHKINQSGRRSRGIKRFDERRQLAFADFPETYLCPPAIYVLKSSAGVIRKNAYRYIRLSAIALRDRELRNLHLPGRHGAPLFRHGPLELCRCALRARRTGFFFDPDGFKELEKRWLFRHDDRFVS